jgi:hypothetical protein
MCIRARREYIHVRYPQGLLSIYQRVWREYILLSPFVRYSQGLLSICPRVRREYISFSDKVTLNSPGAPFYVHQNQKGVHPPVRYPQGLLSIYQRVRREYILLSDKVTALTIFEPKRTAQLLAEVVKIKNGGTNVPI